MDPRPSYGCGFVLGRIGGVLLAALFALGPGPAARGSAQPAPDAAPTVDVRVSERYYTVTGDSLDVVVAKLNRMRLPGAGGRLSQGTTRYDIIPEYRALAGAGGCRLADLRLDVRIVITLPRWPEVDHRPPEERRRWGIIEDAVREHEYVHRDLTVDGAKALAEDLDGREAGACGTLRRAIRGQLSVHGERIRRAHADFDRRTPPTLSLGGPPG